MAPFLLAVACAPGTHAGGPPETAVPPAHAPIPPERVERGPLPSVVRYGPSAMRYVVYRQLLIEQTFSGQLQRQELGARVYVGVVITGPADTTGYPTTFTVDSVLPDSGTPQPIAGAMAKVRALVIAGRLAPRGDFQGSMASDTAGAQSIAQLVGNFRDFMPRIPAEGLRVGAAWTDTVTLTQRGSGGVVTRRITTRSAVTSWDQRDGARSLRIESTAWYSVAGSGQIGGQSFEVSGTGTTTGRAFVAEDGRFLGGDSRDSTSLTESLPAQSLSIPVIQVLRSSVSLRP